MAGGRPIEIQLGIESRDAERGAERIADALDDVTSAADDLGSDGARSTERLNDALSDTSDAARDAGRDTERALGDVEDAADDAARVIDRDLTQALRDAEDASADAGRGMGDNISQGAADGAEGGSETIGEFKDEATANFAEVAGSFSGDMTSAVDLVQGTLGGLAGSIPGGLGLALGGLAIGAGAFAQSWIAETERVEARVAEMFDDMLASGAAYISNDYILTKYYEIIQGAEDAILSEKDLQKITEQTGLKQEQVALAFAGNGEQMRLVQDKLIEKKQVFLDQLSDEDDMNDSAAKSGASWTDQSIKQAQDRADAITSTEDSYKQARDALSEYGAVGSGALRELNTAEIDYAAVVAESTTAIAENGATVDINTEQGRANQTALLDQAESAQAYREALALAGGSTDELTRLTASQRDAFVNAATAAGMTRTEADALADSYGLVPEAVTTDARLTGKQAVETDLADLARDRSVNINPRVDAYEFNNDVADLLGRSRQMVVDILPKFGKGLA